MMQTAPQSRRSLWLATMCLTSFVCSHSARHVGAATIFESGSLGTVGFSAQDLLDQDMPGANVNPAVFLGARFQLHMPVLTSRVGGHFVGFESTDSLFGAIISLSDGTDLPDSSDLTTPDVLGAIVMDLPTLSNDVFGSIEVLLPPGWYAVVFGSGLFGADGGGVALRNNPDIGTPSYIQQQPIISGTGWGELSPFFEDLRFVVEGTIIPEPATLALALLGTAVLLSTRRR